MSKIGFFLRAIGICIIAMLVAFVLTSQAQPKFDKADFPADAEQFVEDCLGHTDSVVFRMNGDPMSLACTELGTTFTTSDQMNAECYALYDNDWSVEACGSSNTGSIEAAKLACNRQLLVHVQNADMAYCLGLMEVADIYPGDDIRCYNTGVEPAREVNCPEEFEQMATMPSDTMEGAAPAIPPGLSDCNADMLVFDEIGGDTFCVDPDDTIVLEDNREYMLSCYDPAAMEAIDCPRDLLGEEAQELNEYPA